MACTIPDALSAARDADQPGRRMSSPTPKVSAVSHTPSRAAQTAYRMSLAVTMTLRETGRAMR